MEAKTKIENKTFIKVSLVYLIFYVLDTQTFAKLRQNCNLKTWPFPVSCYFVFSKQLTVNKCFLKN